MAAAYFVVNNDTGILSLKFIFNGNNDFKDYVYKGMKDNINGVKYIPL